MAEATTARTVSVIGLGVMGSALAKALLANHHRVTVWNRTASKGAPLEQAGAKVAGSVAEAAEASDVVIVSVLDYGVSNALLQAQDVSAKLKGKVLVQLVTGIPREAREGEAWAKQNGTAYLDGAIMGYPKDIGTPECTILYAGSESVFKANEPLLGTLGGNALFVGENVGNASTLDRSMSSFYYGAMAGFFHGAAIVQSEGFPVDDYVSTLVPLLAGVADSMQRCGDMIGKGSYAGSEASLNVHAASVEHILQLSQENGIDRSHPESLLAHFKRAIAAGHGQNELGALFEAIKKKATPSS